MSKADPTARLARTIAADVVALPTAIDAWLAALRTATADGFGVGSGSAGPRPVNHISDPTGEQATHNTTGTGAGYGPADEYQLVLDNLRVAAAALEIVARRTARRHVHHGDTPTCSGGHLQGAHIPRSAGGWHDATCCEPAELVRREDGGYALRYEGLCGRCARRCQRWKQRHDVVRATTRATSDDA